MAQQVGQAALQSLQILGIQVGLGHAAVVLQGADRGYHNHRIGGEARHAALDVQELLCTQVGAEAGLSDGIVAQLQSHTGGHDGVAAVGDVGERTAVDKGGSTLQGLDQVGLEGVLQKSGHGAGGLQVPGGDGFLVVGIANNNAAQTLLQIGDGGGQTQNCHDLAGYGDVKAVLPGNTLHPSAQTVHHVAQLAVVHVHAPLPGDALDVDSQGVALLDVVVQHSGQQVVGRTDGMEVAGKVEIDILHRHHLSVSAAGSAALDAEDRAQRGLTQGHQSVLAHTAQSVGQTHRGGGLTLAGGGGVDGGDQDQLAVGSLRLIEQAVVDLSLVAAVVLQVLLSHAGSLGDVANGLHGGALRNFNIGQHNTISPLSAPFSQKKGAPVFYSVRPDGRH